MEQLVDIIFNNFDFGYMMAVNVLTYILIKILDYINGEKTVSVLLKRIILVISIVILALLYIVTGYENKIILLNSAILSPVFYSWILRPILVKLKIGYKQIDKNIK